MNDLMSVKNPTSLSVFDLSPLINIFSCMSDKTWFYLFCFCAVKADLTLCPESVHTELTSKEDKHRNGQFPFKMTQDYDGQSHPYRECL